MCLFITNTYELSQSAELDFLQVVLILFINQFKVLGYISIALKSHFGKLLFPQDVKDDFQNFFIFFTELFHTLVYKVHKFFSNLYMLKRVQNSLDAFKTRKGRLTNLVT